MTSSTGQMARQVPIAAPSTGDEEWEACREPLLNGWLTQGPKVVEFEQAFAQRHQVDHAIATTSCTTALHLALAAAGIGSGDEVIVPAFTWVATANVVRYCGATPVFVDVDPTTYNLDVDRLQAALTSRTRAVIPVHLFGLCADTDPVRATVGDNLFVLEDAACAAGASYHGRPAGTLGDAAAFSFHPRKSITTGEGGMITTNQAELADRARRLRNHGASISEEDRHRGPQPFLLADFDEVGFNYRMTDLQAAIGSVQLRKLDRFIAERRRWASWYAQELASLAWLRVPDVPPGLDHAWQAFVCVVDEDAPAPRNRLMAALEQKGISTRPGTHAVTELGAYRAWRGHCPVAARLEEQTMALPLHNRMSEDDFHYVVDELRRL
ncbi:MAG TPA: DegT/DnrJ/EryC1/StrS family aminotransferase [Solirubrobacteraceae bacterium]|jgi:dTDP-4-amino-4,6-dideoxygalactose transaminase